MTSRLIKVNGGNPDVGDNPHVRRRDARCSQRAGIRQSVLLTCISKVKAMLQATEVPTAPQLHLEDFTVGQTFSSGRLKVDAEQIKTFAAAFDPQPFHLDEESARNTFFKGLAASGWHTAALTMRLLVGSPVRPANGIIGAGAEISWPKPTRPGDELHLESEVLEVRPSQSRPDRGMVKVQTKTINQNGDTVQILIANLIVTRRPPAVDAKS